MTPAGKLGGAIVLGAFESLFTQDAELCYKASRYRFAHPFVFPCMNASALLLKTPLSKTEVICLEGKEPFGIGGRRLCFTHPSDASKCVKVLRTDARRTIRGAKSQAYFTRFRPEYDNNAHEKAVLEGLYRRIGPSMSQHLPRCYGMFPTDINPGLVLDLVRDYDGQISQSIRELVSTGTPLESLKSAFDEFGRFLLKHQILTRNLLDHNLIASRQSDGGWKIYLVDGFGDPAWIPIGRWITPLRLSRVRKCVASAWPRMEKFAREGGVSQEVVQNSSWGQGFLAHRGID